MRRIAIINQKGGVGKTTTSANLGAALAEQGRRVVVVDMDPQANASLHLGIEAGPNDTSVYSVLVGEKGFGECLRTTSAPGLSVLPSNIELSGAELELASAIGRDSLIRDAIDDWCAKHRAAHGEDPADYVIFDCPPSLGLLSINALAAAGEVLITVQTQFLALMGMSKLVEVVQLIRKRLNPELTITGIVPCLYDSRLKLNREVLGEVRKYFPGQVFKTAIRSNVKVAEAPSFGVSILDYASESNGAQDYRMLALEVIEQESRDPALANLPAAREVNELARERAALQQAVREEEFAARDADATPPSQETASRDDDVVAGESDTETSAAAQQPAVATTRDDAPVERDEVPAPDAPHEEHRDTAARAVANEAVTSEAAATPRIEPVVAVEPSEPAAVAKEEQATEAPSPAAAPREDTTSAATDDADPRAHEVTAPDVDASPRAAFESAAPAVPETSAETTRTDAPAEVARDEAPEREPEAEPEHVLRPAPRRTGAVEDELRILRAKDLPQLPPEAFEVPR